MNKDLQDQAWRSLPAEFREEVKAAYRYNELRKILSRLFGHHNLTSDEEYPEMLMCEKERVQQQYNRAIKLRDYDSDSRWNFVGGQIVNVLVGLFGSKCLLDEPASKPASKKAEPKFKEGDKVLCEVEGNEMICLISSYNPLAKEYKLLCGGQTIAYRREDSLKPYIEKTQEFRVGEKVKVINGNYIESIGTIHEYSEDDDTWAVYLQGFSYPINFDKDFLEPYTEPTEPKSDDMEEKELNLCEILKGHENDKFYSPMFGDVYLNAILIQGQPYPINLIAGNKEIYINPNGYWDNGYIENTMVILYPSREAFLKYPLDARAAWMEWEQANKPKVELRVSYTIKEKIFNGSGGFSLTFNSQEEAQQAVEAVKTILEQFHKEHQQ